MTIFAAARDTSVPMTSRSKRMPAASEMPAHSSRRVLRETEDEHMEPFAKRHCPEVSESRPVSQSLQGSNPNQEDNRNNQDTSRHDTSHHNHEDTNHDQSIPKQVIDLASQKHGPMFLKLNSEKQAWRLKLHRNLGHPGQAKLSEFCRQLQCPESMIQAISDLKCSTCQEARGPVISRPSSIHEPCDFGDIVSMDAITWTNAKGSQFHFYHFLDQSTLFNTAVVAPAHATDHACRALHTGWFNWAGPPNMLCVDAGTELNSEEFSNYLQRHSVKCRTCAAEAHWQNARTERHGGILQLMLKKIDAEQPIDTYDQLSTALSHVTSTKNQWSQHRGYPPETLVFGKGVRIPGSITSDPTIAAHATALSSMPDGARFRQELSIREAARKAFAMVDNDQTLRRAIVHRSRPHRGFYEKGEWVVLWKKKGEAEGNWIGPMQVIIQEDQNVVWVSRNHKLYRE